MPPGRLEGQSGTVVQVAEEMKVGVSGHAVLQLGRKNQVQAVHQGGER